MAKVQASAEAALDDYMRESGPVFSTPSNGYAVEREQEGRGLFSYDVDGRTKVSMFAADGVRDWDGDEGWGVRAWAQCDPSELPSEVTDDLNIGVWEDESGRRVPMTRIRSFQGAERCSWTDITFLLVGPEEKADWYVRDTYGGDLRGCCARPTTTWKRSPRVPPTQACAATAGSGGLGPTRMRLTW